MAARPLPAVVVYPLHQRHPWVVIRVEEPPCILPRSLQDSIYTSENTCSPCCRQHLLCPGA